MNIVLIGMRGSGKTTIGRLLAARLQRPFIDTDDLVTTASGATIRTLFERDGEAAFRRLERAAVAQACNPGHAVIAAAGGAVLDADNRALLAQAGFVIWLHATPDTLAKRIESDTATAESRPPLTTLPLREELASILQQREPLYREMANETIEIDGTDAEDVVEKILKAMPKSAARPD